MSAASGNWWTEAITPRGTPCSRARCRHHNIVQQAMLPDESTRPPRRHELCPRTVGHAAQMLCSVPLSELCKARKDVLLDARDANVRESRVRRFSLQFRDLQHV